MGEFVECAAFWDYLPIDRLSVMIDVHLSQSFSKFCQNGLFCAIVHMNFLKIDCYDLFDSLWQYKDHHSM